MSPPHERQESTSLQQLDDDREGDDNITTSAPRSTTAGALMASAGMMDSRSPTPDSSGPRDRLPNLFEVLSRRTFAPVDLFSFYIYMRDVQRSVDYLDFW